SMSSIKLPAEWFHHILSFCDHPTTCALSKVCQRFAAIVADKHALDVGKCWRRGVALPSDVHALSSNHDDLPLDLTLLLEHNPFGGGIFLNPSTVRGFEVGKEESRPTFSSEWRTADEMERATIEFAFAYESIGIPRWIIDGLRPRIAVSAVLRRRDGSPHGSRVSARMGVWRLDGMSELGHFTSQESIRFGFCSVANGETESIFDVGIEPSASQHGHPALGGSDGLVIGFSTRNDVQISDVRVRFELPDEIPSQFFDWLTESRAFRDSRAMAGSCTCFDIELLGLYP
ncbi:hypothetical protein PENTCL1PPCAC_13082, partial [Pristionchus entomophagus]